MIEFQGKCAADHEVVHRTHGLLRIAKLDRWIRLEARLCHASTRRRDLTLAGKQGAVLRQRPLDQVPYGLPADLVEYGLTHCRNSQYEGGGEVEYARHDRHRTFVLNVAEPFPAGPSQRTSNFHAPLIAKSPLAVY
jgi:hypothetical protein